VKGDIHVNEKDLRSNCAVVFGEIVFQWQLGYIVRSKNPGACACVRRE
jgi:hypothetical protein